MLLLLVRVSLLWSLLSRVRATKCFRCLKKQTNKQTKPPRNQNPERMKLTVDSRLAQRWTFLLCDDDEDDEQTAGSLFFFWKPLPQLSRTQTACFSPPPGPNANLRLMWTYSDREPVPDGRAAGAVRSASSSVRLKTTFPLIALPRDCSERLPLWWTSNFFLSGLTFH